MPQELLNLNTLNIYFGLNLHNTLIWLRNTNPKDFQLRFLPLYLDEETFDKELMSWIGIKHNPCKSRMKYLLPADILKKKG
jgi:hypothetical protein